MQKLILTLSVALFGLVVPIAEIGDTHAFNSYWPGHARLFEVWQLLTKSSVAGIIVWLAWHKPEVRAAALLGLTVLAGFLGVFLLSRFSGGSILHTDGAQLAVLGVNVAIVAMTLALGALGLFGARNRKGKSS